MSDFLFSSVVPGVPSPQRPRIGFRGNPNGFVQAPLGTLLTEESGKKWCRGYNAQSDNLGWFEVGSATGQPSVLYGNFYITDPNGVQTSAGPAVWFGYDQSVWVKTVPINDNQSWKFLGKSTHLGPASFFIEGGGLGTGTG